MVFITETENKLGQGIKQMWKRTAIFITNLRRRLRWRAPSGANVRKQSRESVMLRLDLGKSFGIRKEGLV